MRRTGVVAALASARLSGEPGWSSPPGDRLDHVHGVRRGDGVADARCRGGGSPGYCKDDTGVTVVVDFTELGGDIVVRCAPGPVKPGYSGLDAFRAPGSAVSGTQRWGLAFVCRIQGRPAANESLQTRGNPDYHERCVDTPPSSAYWGYWYARTAGLDLQQRGAEEPRRDQGWIRGVVVLARTTAGGNPPRSGSETPGDHAASPSTSPALRRRAVRTTGPALDSRGTRWTGGAQCTAPAAIRPRAGLLRRDQSEGRGRRRNPVHVPTGAQGATHRRPGKHPSSRRHSVGTSTPTTVRPTTEGTARVTGELPSDPTRRQSDSSSKDRDLVGRRRARGAGRWSRGDGMATVARA